MKPRNWFGRLDSRSWRPPPFPRRARRLSGRSSRSSPSTVLSWGKSRRDRGPFAVSESGARTRAERRFTGADQLLFATLSGDKNPMHMDDEAARLTPAGARVVHGVHIALWALEALASQDHSFNDVALLQVKFSKFAVVDQEVGLEFSGAKDGSAKIDVLSGGQALATISLKRSPGLKMESGVAPTAEVLANLDRPMEPTQDEMAAFHARLDCAAPAIEFSRAFPRLSEALGAERVRGLALLSTLVGMACPGLHSIFSGFTAEIAPIGTGRPGIDVRTRSVDPRFRMIAMDFEGAGLKGAVSAFERFPPIETPLASIAAVVKPGEFAGRHALVVGGSRGLGAATAKMIVAGGGRAVITYARGAKQAEAVQRRVGGSIWREQAALRSSSRSTSRRRRPWRRTRRSRMSIISRRRESRAQPRTSLTRLTTPPSIASMSKASPGWSPPCRKGRRYRYSIRHQSASEN